ncbi:MAG: glycine zipper family protein [Pseudomonadota bacterium]
MNFHTSRLSTAVASLCLVGLVAGCVTAPQGPRVAVMPTPGKPLELFSQEDQYCRNYAQQTLGPDTRAERAVGAAVVGTIIGAAIGSATSTRRYNNTGAGAATGLMMGSAIGAGTSAEEGHSAQQRYDIAYEQCMVSKNNQPSRGYYRQSGRVVYVPQAAPSPAPSPNYPPPNYPPPPPQ